MTNTRTQTLLTAPAYTKDLLKRINAATTRIAIVATTFHGDDAISNALIDALCDAADRGVYVSVGADAFTYIEPKGSIFGAKGHSMRAIKAHKVQRKLKKHGAEFHWLGRMSNFIFAGRTHSKWTIIDDMIYSFGGINLDHVSFTNTDLMIRITDNKIANRLFVEHGRVFKADRGGHALRSQKITINETSTILIDGGIPGDSVIYRRACTLAREASQITFVSQYCPTGRLNRILKRKQATLFFNHWRRARWANMLIIQLGMLISRQSTLYNRRPYLHAKFILFTMPDKTEIALTGSHNFTNSGVLTGTREIALETSDQDTITQLKKFLDNHVK